jgi:D-alanine-D-alanine ligase
MVRDMTGPADPAVKTRKRPKKPVAVHVPAPAREAGAGGPPSGAPGGANVTVLMGGPSSEREVSLLSGRAIADALRRLGHRVREADISPSDPSALDAPGIDAVFIALHGAFGESGDVQDLCEARGHSYTGSGALSSRLAMDKVASKEAFVRAGLATPPWVVVERGLPPAQLAERLGRIPGPAVLKPIDGGSSVDVVIARDPSARDRALAELLPKYGRLLVEQFVEGREMTVGILGAGTLPVLEIIPSREFYDYTAKYADGSGTRYRFDLGLSPEGVGRIEAAAWTAFQSLGCRDMGRVDFILDAQGVAWVLEINTIPGFTGHSLLPMAAAKAGIGFDPLVGRILDLALARRMGALSTRGPELVPQGRAGMAHENMPFPETGKGMAPIHQRAAEH